MNKSITIGITSPYLQGSYYGKLLLSISEYAKKFGVKIIASRTFQDRNLFNWPLSFDHIDGFIIISNRTVSETLLERILELKKPIIGIGDQADVIYRVITTKNYEGSYNAVKHLIRLGHRKIAFAGYTIKSSDVLKRYEGYLAALSDYGVPYAPDLFIEIQNNIEEGGLEAAQYIIDNKLSCTAVMAGTDANAIHMMNRLVDAGYRIPEDIAICGYDNIELSQICEPGLTTVDQS